MEWKKTPRGQMNKTGSLTNKSVNNTKKNTPPRAGAFSQKQSRPSTFRLYYDRSDLPVSVDNHCRGPKLKWKVEIEKLDYHHYLPLFFDGLKDIKEPYASIAMQGTMDLIRHGPDRVLNVVPQLIIPIKQALDTRNPKIMVRTLETLKALVGADELVGEALVPYYRQILPMLNAFKCKNVNCGDGIDYSQSKNENVGDLIEDTLQVLERNGGEDAYINIKYMVPTYESCVLN